MICPKCNQEYVKIDMETRELNHPCDTYWAIYYVCFQRGCGHRWKMELPDERLNEHKD